MERQIPSLVGFLFQKTGVASLSDTMSSYADTGKLYLNLKMLYKLIFLSIQFYAFEVKYLRCVLSKLRILTVITFRLRGTG